jgi:hypothetical protein
MAILDSKLEFSDAQVISASSASAVTSTNAVNLWSALKDAWGTSITGKPGEGNNGLVVNFQIATALNASSYIVAKVYHHTASAAVASGAVLGSVTFAAADAAGTRKNFRLPSGTINKWLECAYSVVGSNMTTGAIDAWLGLDTETPTT